MPSENKQLAKRAKREAKRKALKHQNAVKKVATNKARRLVTGRREALIKLRDDIFDFIVKKDSFKKFLKDMITGANNLKATNDPKYDGLIVTAYEKGLAKVEELIEPRLTTLARVVDNIDPNKQIDTTISEYLEASTLLNELSGIFSEILSTVNRYHNHNVSIYKNTEDPEKIVEFSEDDFDFKFLSELSMDDAKKYMEPNKPAEDTPKEEPAEPAEPLEDPPEEIAIEPLEDIIEEAPADPVEPTEDTPNIHEDIEATVVVDDAKQEE